jgi:hypothetical protein
MEKEETTEINEQQFYIDVSKIKKILKMYYILIFM